MSKPVFLHSPKPVLAPAQDAPWAQTVVLNPAFVKDEKGQRLHMLFRASGPGAAFGGVNPASAYPICLGYAFSDDNGQSWTPDFSRPALFPALKDTREGLFISLKSGARALNHCNGCVEDPRLFRFEGKLYLTVACRIFPPGAYWVHDEPMQCAPQWARNGQTGLGAAVEANVSATALCEVDLGRLAARRYEEAFSYLGVLTEPDKSDNRDVFLFPRRIEMEPGKKSVVMLHRPHSGEAYGVKTRAPSAFIAWADSVDDLLAQKNVKHRLFLEPQYAWEADRVGASCPPIPLPEKRWLIPYHAKQDAVVGYTQSFLIAQECAQGGLRITHRSPERLFYASEPWELNGKFKTPCVFTCAAELLPDGDTLRMTYGAADTFCGAATASLKEILAYLEKFPV